jgi:hypothetical protein
MKEIRILQCLVVSSALLLAPLSGIAEDEDLEPKALFQKRCTKCHTLDRTNRKENSEFWRETVSRMKEKPFSGISDRDAQVIADYLVDTHSD